MLPITQTDDKNRARRNDRRQTFNSKLRELRDLIPTSTDSGRGSTIRTLDDAIHAIRQLNNAAEVDLQSALQRMYWQTVSLCIVFSSTGKILWSVGKGLQALQWNARDTSDANVFERTFWKDLPMLMRAISEGGEGGNFPLRLRGAKGQYIEFVVRIREQVLHTAFGDDRVYSIVGALAQGSEPGPGVKPARRKPLRVISFMRAGGTNGVNAMSCQVISDVNSEGSDAPFGVLASEWMRNLPHITHPRDMDRMVTSFRTMAIKREVVIFQLNAFHYETHSLIRITTTLCPCAKSAKRIFARIERDARELLFESLWIEEDNKNIDEKGTLIGLIGDSRELEDDDTWEGDERNLPVESEPYVGDVSRAIARVEMRIKEKREEYELVADMREKQEHGELVQAYADLAKYMSAFGQGVREGRRPAKSPYRKRVTSSSSSQEPGSASMMSSDSQSHAYPPITTPIRDGPSRFERADIDALLDAAAASAGPGPGLGPKAIAGGGSLDTIGPLMSRLLEEPTTHAAGLAYQRSLDSRVDILQPFSQGEQSWQPMERQPSAQLGQWGARTPQYQPLGQLNSGVGSAHPYHILHRHSLPQTSGLGHVPAVMSSTIQPEASEFIERLLTAPTSGGHLGYPPGGELRMPLPQATVPRPQPPPPHGRLPPGVFGYPGFT